MERNEASFADLAGSRRVQSSFAKATLSSEIAAASSSFTLDAYRPSALLLPQTTSKRFVDSSLSLPNPTSTSAALDTFRSLQDGAGAYRTPKLTPSVQSCRSQEESSFRSPCLTPTTRVVRSEQEYGYQSGPKSPQVSALRASEEGFQHPARSPHLDLLRHQHEDPFDHHQPGQSMRPQGQGPPLTPPQSPPSKSPAAGSVQKLVRKDVEGFKVEALSPLIDAVRAQDKFRL